MRTIHEEEELEVKQNIPWQNIDPLIIECVRLANEIPGLVTVQSCEGHVRPNGDGFSVDSALVAFKFTNKFTVKEILELADHVKISDVSVRFFDDGSYWIILSTYPSFRCRLFQFFQLMKASKLEGK